MSFTSARLDSTFDFGSSSDCDSRESDCGDVKESDSLDEVAPDMSSEDGNSVEFSFYESSSEGEELWEFSESEEENTTNNVTPTVENMFGISFFLSFFHLFYRVSERGMISLLSFLRMFFSFVGTFFSYPILLELAAGLPRTLYGVRKHFKRESEYHEYAVCSKCSQIYEISDCTVRRQGQFESKRCTYVEYPNHPHQSRRVKCDAVLMKQVKSHGKSMFVPKKIFLYRSVINALIAMMKRPGFLQHREHWREHPANSSRGLLGDIYDGQVWNNLQHISGTPYLSMPGNLCLAMNIDWFNPYKDAPYSVGAVYLVVLNLPRNERYKLRNVILAGVIPGPNEPTGVINSFLNPLVTDLLVLYEGVTFRKPSSHLGMTTVRAVLTCITCDLPATRKACGFANFNSLRGCSKCVKEFPTGRFGEKPDYSGYDYHNWEAREATTQKMKGEAFKNAPTATAQKEILRSYGAKYTVLSKLPSFDVIKYHVIDPMHNIFLGIAKHTTKVWKETGLLLVREFATIQEKVDLINPPTKLGRIPRKIAAGFTAFTADEWKHWILIYSLFSLYGVLPDDHYKCWCVFVQGCRLLCLPILSKSQVDKAHLHLVEFCRTFQNLYGPSFCTPNMHMSLHPLSSFWCFPFERFNGTLEGFKKSWTGPERQMFNKFLDMQHIYWLQTTNHNDLVSLVSQNSDMLQDQLGSSSFDQTQLQDVVTLKQIDNFLVMWHY